MEKIPVIYRLIIPKFGSMTGKVYRQTLLVYSVPSINTTLYVGVYCFEVKELSQNLDNSKVENLAYPIDEITAVFNPLGFGNSGTIREEVRSKLLSSGYSEEKIAHL